MSIKQKIGTERMHVMTKRLEFVRVIHGGPGSKITIVVLYVCQSCGWAPTNLIRVGNCDTTEHDLSSLPKFIVCLKKIVGNDTIVAAKSFQSIGAEGMHCPVVDPKGALSVDATARRD